MNRFFEPDPLSRAFEHQKPPTLLYITKQQFGGKKHDRPMHSHDSFCELLLVYRGFGSYAIRNHSFPIQEGDILFYNQDESHEVRSISNTEIGTYCFAFFGLKFEALPANHIIPGNSHPVRSSGTQFEFLHQLCERAYQSLDTDVAGKALAQSLALSFLLIARELDEASFIHPSSEDDIKMADRIRRYLDIHYTEQIVLSDVAAAFGCSESYISHVFKRCIGYSPIQYVIRRRIGLAQTYLTTTDYTATHIATLVGYDNTNYFNTIFTKIVGISPMRYKKQYLETMRGKAMP
ncbi:MAG: AraC family transcriptional regulator [Oscillibacter sp.]|nr:AraC family transcriptional regulator [Oscillibacter sp.]